MRCCSCHLTSEKFDPYFEQLQHNDYRYKFLTYIYEMLYAFWQGDREIHWVSICVSFAGSLQTQSRLQSSQFQLHSHLLSLRHHQHQQQSSLDHFLCTHTLDAASSHACWIGVAVIVSSASMKLLCGARLVLATQANSSLLCSAGQKWVTAKVQWWVMGSKSKHDSFQLWITCGLQVKPCDSSFTCAIPECL